MFLDSGFASIKPVRFWDSKVLTDAKYGARENIRGA